MTGHLLYPLACAPLGLTPSSRSLFGWSQRPPKKSALLLRRGAEDSRRPWTAWMPRSVQAPFREGPGYILSPALPPDPQGRKRDNLLQGREGDRFQALEVRGKAGPATV